MSVEDELLESYLNWERGTGPKSSESSVEVENHPRSDKEVVEFLESIFFAPERADRPETGNFGHVPERWW